MCILVVKRIAIIVFEAVREFGSLPRTIHNKLYPLECEMDTLHVYHTFINFSLIMVFLALFSKKHKAMKGLLRQTNFMYKTHNAHVLTSDHVYRTENTHLQMAFPYFWHTTNKFENTISVNQKEAHNGRDQSLCTLSRIPDIDVQILHSLNKQSCFKLLPLAMLI